MSFLLFLLILQLRGEQNLLKFFGMQVSFWNEIPLVNIQKLEAEIAGL